MGKKICTALVLFLLLLAIPGCAGFSEKSPQQAGAKSVTDKQIAAEGIQMDAQGKEKTILGSQEERLQACEFAVTGKDGSSRKLRLVRKDKEHGEVTLRFQEGQGQAERVLTGVSNTTPFKSIQDMVKDLNLKTWKTLPFRGAYASDKYRASVWLQFDNDELKFSTDQELPPVQDYVFYQLYTCLRYYIDGYAANLPYPLGADRPRDTVEVHGREIPILAGSGDPFITNAILDYGNRKWWVEEELVGNYSLVPGACESAGRVETAALQITNDGDIILTVNGWTLKGFLDKERRYQASYTCSFSGSFVYVDDSYRTLKFKLPALPYPEKRPAYTFILQRT